MKQHTANLVSFDSFAAWRKCPYTSMLQHFLILVFILWDCRNEADGDSWDLFFEHIVIIVRHEQIFSIK